MDMPLQYTVVGGGEVKTEQKGCRLDAGLDGRHLAASQQIL
jgi:hypothetical protein